MGFGVWILSMCMLQTWRHRVLGERGDMENVTACGGEEECAGENGIGDTGSGQKEEAEETEKDEGGEGDMEMGGKDVEMGAEEDDADTATGKEEEEMLIAGKG